MYLKRSLIKRQAKELIRGNVFKLFVISLIVSLCVSLIPGIISGASGYNSFFRMKELFDAFSDRDRFEDYVEDYFKDYFGDYFGDDFEDYFDEYFDDYYDEFFNNSNGGNSSNGSDDSNYFDSFGDDGWDFRNFGGELSVIPTENEAVAGAYNNFNFGFHFSLLPFIITSLLSPLAITLAWLYVSFIRGRRFEFDEGIKSVFVDAFKVNYLKKVGVYVLRMIIMGLLLMLFIIPGIIFAYSSYFAFQIMCDYPELSAWEAIKLSKKMVRGNRFELFLMNLSFIPWAILCIFIFPIIYVLPYVATTNALYYENFRLRAIQEGRVTEDDFLSDAQRCAKYGAMGNNQYYSPNSAQQGTYYHAPQQPQQAQQYGVPNYSAPYQPYNQTANPQYGAAPNQPYGVNVNHPYQPVTNQPYGTPVNQPSANQPYGAPASQPYSYAPSTPSAQPQTPPAEPQQAPQEEIHYEAPKPAEPEDYPWEGK